MTAAQPLLVCLVGDSPRMPTGLGRIARDLAELLAANAAPLGIQLCQFGWEDLAADLTYNPSWPFVPFHELGQDWGAGQIRPAIDSFRRGLGLDWDHVVLLTVWDPARCFEYRLFPGHWWGYFAVDGARRDGAFGGPAAHALSLCDRPLAYTQYGAQVLTKVRELHAANVRKKINWLYEKPIQYLPHGHWWEPRALVTPDQVEPILGCVASNQPRKDWGLFFGALQCLRDVCKENWRGWLHIDREITGTWSLPELATYFADVPVSITMNLNEDDLRARYEQCRLTLCVGRGEGFGYPIVESLASGVPCATVDYAGGAHLVPEEWRYQPDWYAIDNPYLIQRPYTNEGAVALKLQAMSKRIDQRTAPFCQGRVAHLHWDRLRPYWLSWFRQGFAQVRERHAEE